MKSLLGFGTRPITGRQLLLALAVFLAVFAFTHLAKFPGSLASYKEVAQGQKIFDMAPSFTADEVYERLDRMGDAGRSAYRQLILTIDFVFPLAMLIFLVTWTRFFVASAKLQGRVLSRSLAILPVLYFVSDLGENLMVLTILSNYPARVVASEFVGYVTVLKRGSMLIAIIGPPLIGVQSCVGFKMRVGLGDK